MREAAQDGNEFAMRHRLGIFQHRDRMGVGQPAQSGEEPDARASCRLQRGRAPGEEDPKQLAVTDQIVDFVRRDPDEEQDEYPHLRRNEPRPAELSKHVLDETAAAQNAAGK